MTSLENRLRALAPDTLRRLLRGIEKESLRIRPDGTLADTPHPPELGSALTHPHITTDFSESQLEMITGVHDAATGCMREITEIHQFVYRHIGHEMLWVASMPCRLPDDDEIPLGRYGSSNVGRTKTVYRQGLSYRYGRRMQTISGIHYNFSLPEEAWPSLMQADQSRASEQDYRNAAYFSLIRNFRRHSWLLLYLFGASPAVCRSFVEGRPHRLQPLAGSAMYLPHATSLRMGPLGYQSDAQASLAASFNCLESYAASLQRALDEPYPAYEAIGIHDGEGRYRQLATTLLQIENEFYGTIRPKRRIRPGERPLRALAERGVEYVEVRCMDLDPFEPVGIEAGTMRFLDVFLLHCLLSDSPKDSADEIAGISSNQHKVAQYGRDPALKLRRPGFGGGSGCEIGVADWGRELLAEYGPIAGVLDEACGGDGHRQALERAARALGEPALTPSARILETMAREYDNSFPEFALAASRRHRDAILALPFPGSLRERFERMARESVAEQRAIEAADSLPFEEYRQRYLAGTLPVGD